MNYSHWYGFDTENDPQGRVTLAALVAEDGRSWVWPKAGEFRKWCDGCDDDSPVVICHNLEYDLINEFAAYYPYLNLTYLKGRLIMAKYGHVAFLDSFNHYRMTLAKIGEAFGIKKLDFDIHSTDYVTTDARICLTAMVFTRDYLRSIGGEIGATAGSSAMSVWRHMTGDEFLCGPVDTPWLRQGYAGGRTELFADEAHGDIRGYDVNSMYPYCMISEFPMLTNEDKGITKTKGMAEITVCVPTDHYVGPLVWRDPRGRLVYPVGRFRGIWTYDEIRYAESIGCRVDQVHKAIGGNYCERPFDDFIYKIYAKRKASTNAAEREVLKVILNSLYGKLAARSVITRVVSKYDLLKNNSKRLKDVQWIDHNRGLLDFHAPQPRSVNVLWGAMITANARVLLTKYLRQCPPERLIYCDTDSVYVNGFELPVTSDLGGVKLEKQAKVMRIIQPKVYQLDDFYRAKGVPKPKYDEKGVLIFDYAKSFIEDGMAEFEAPVRFRESLRLDQHRGLRPNQWIPRSKSIRTKYEGKKLFHHRYYPPVIGEQTELFPTCSKKGY